MATITTTIPTPEQIADERSRQFFARMGRQPYGLAVKAIADQLRNAPIPRNRFI